jgi:hypothetical protein
MGILDEVGKIAGAVAAVEAAEKLDPDASLLTKGIAAVAGFKGAGALESYAHNQEANEADAADSQA